MTGQSVIVRADASLTGGAGHVMRSIALAQELAARGSEVQFACRSLTPMARNRVAGEGFEIIDLEWDVPIADLSQRYSPDWIVVDLGPTFHPSILVDVRGRVLVIDDIGQDFRQAPDLVLNQNLHASATTYSGVEESAILQGASFLLFRDEFCWAACGGGSGELGERAYSSHWVVLTRFVCFFPSLKLSRRSSRSH